jgi:hypothetical protein
MSQFDLDSYELTKWERDMLDAYRDANRRPRVSIFYASGFFQGVVVTSFVATLITQSAWWAGAMLGAYIIYIWFVHVVFPRP